MHTLGSYPPRPSSVADDDRAPLRLLAAVAELARHDADAGDAEAAAWLADVATVRPSRRWILTGEPCGRRPPTLAAKVRALAVSRGWPGRLAHGAIGELAELLGVTPDSVRAALRRARRDAEPVAPRAVAAD